MSDFPEYAVICLDGHRPTFPEFPHRLFLLPTGLTVTAALSARGLGGAFLIEPGSIWEVINGTALPVYMAERAPVFLHARHARDLRPLLRHRKTIEARGYSVVVP